MPRSTVPDFLRDPVQRAALAAELHTLADDLEPSSEPVPDFEGGALPVPVDRLTAARVGRLRTWADQVEGYGS